MTSVVGSERCGDGLTEEERANVRVVRALLEAPKPLSAEDEERLAPGFHLRRLGMANLAEMLVQGAADHREHDGYTRASFSDRRDEVVDVIARGDVVWVLFRLTGHHTGQFWGMPASGNPLDLLELGIFRVHDGKVAEGWFMNDELAICRQIGLVDADLLRDHAAAVRGEP